MIFSFFYLFFLLINKKGEEGISPSLALKCFDRLILL